MDFKTKCLTLFFENVRLLFNFTYYYLNLVKQFVLVLIYHIDK